MARRKQQRKKKRGALPAWAVTITDLRDSLDLATQEEFAAVLGSKQGTVSTWLRGDEKRKPSATTFVLMASKAPKPEIALRLLEHAGLDQVTIKDVARKLESNYEALAGPRLAQGQIVRVPGYPQKANRRKGLGAPVPVPAERVPNPVATWHLTLDVKSAAEVLAEGDIIVLDGLDAQRDPMDLNPFWEDLIVIRANTPFYEEGLPEGLWIGRPQLRLAAGGPITDFPWVASFHLANDRFGVSMFRLGQFLDRLPQEKAATLDRDKAALKRETQKSLARALGQLRVREGCQIVGRVIEVILAKQKQRARSAIDGAASRET